MVLKFPGFLGILTHVQTVCIRLFLCKKGSQGFAKNKIETGFLMKFMSIYLGDNLNSTLLFKVYQKVKVQELYSELQNEIACNKSEESDRT